MLQSVVIVIIFPTWWCVLHNKHYTSPYFDPPSQNHGSFSKIRGIVWIMDLAFVEFPETKAGCFSLFGLLLFYLPESLAAPLPRTHLVPSPISPWCSGKTHIINAHLGLKRFNINQLTSDVRSKQVISLLLLCVSRPVH